MILTNIPREISSSTLFYTGSELESGSLNIYADDDFCPSSSSCLVTGDDDYSCLVPDIPELPETDGMTRSWSNYELILTAALVYVTALMALTVWIFCWQKGYFKGWIDKSTPTPVLNDTEGIMTHITEERADVVAHIIHLGIAEIININDNTDNSRFNEKGIN